MKEQKAIIVDGHETCARLNKYLEEEWYTVVKMCPLPSSCGIAVASPHTLFRDKINNRPSCLVIIEREKRK